MTTAATGPQAVEDPTQGPVGISMAGHKGPTPDQGRDDAHDDGSMEGHSQMPDDEHLPEPTDNVTVVPNDGADENSDDTTARDGANSVARAHAHARTAMHRPWMQRFVDTLRDTPVIAMACKSAGVSRVTAYDWRERDEDFRKEWDAALEDGWDGVEDVALRMAKGGSERLVEFLLRGNKAKTYRETHKLEVEHSLEAGTLAVLQEVRTARLSRENVRELSATEAKVLSVNDVAQDAQSCDASKAGKSQPEP